MLPCWRNICLLMHVYKSDARIRSTLLPNGKICPPPFWVMAARHDDNDAPLDAPREGRTGKNEHSKSVPSLDTEVFQTNNSSQEESVARRTNEIDQEVRTQRLLSTIGTAHKLNASTIINDVAITETHIRQSRSFCASLLSMQYGSINPSS